MAVKIRDTVTAEGKKFEKLLKELGKLEVRVGIQEVEKDKEGEYDGEKIYAKAGVRDGKGKVVDSKVSLLDIAMFNELGVESINIPRRPFLRDSVDANGDRINKFLQAMKQEILNGSSAEDVLKKIGVFQKGLIQEQIIKGGFDPNSDKTIQRKGSDTPLVDTGRLRQSINFVIQEKGESD